MGYCPRCGENTNLGTGPDVVAERRQPLRIPAGSNIVKLPSSHDGDTIEYAGMRFKISRQGSDIVLHAID